MVALLSQFIDMVIHSKYDDPCVVGEFGIREGPKSGGEVDDIKAEQLKAPDSLETISSLLVQFHSHLFILSQTISRDQPAKLKPTTQVLLLLTGLLSAYTMSSIIQRLMRPFSSSTMHFAPETAGSNSMAIPEGAQKATLAAGCFWGIEHMYRKDFGGKGLLDARVGYIGGDTKSPSYRAVCSGRTGRELIPYPFMCMEREERRYANTKDDV